ncbi:MAG: hypothetical protein J5764_05685 [Bacteroidales bacterium]|nr:hypothetical protein [Bacteroidales bacterium]
MIRRLSYLLALLLLLLLPACVQETVGDTPDGPYIEMKLYCNDPVESKAGADGVRDGSDRYNENLISTVDFFFWPIGQEDQDATFHVRRTSGNRRSDVFRMEITSEDINNRIFPSYPSDIRQAKVMAVVNYPGTLVADENNLSGTSKEDIESLIVTTDFVSPVDHRQASFVMSGVTTIDLRGRSQIMAATGAIALERYACKMTVAVNVANTVTLDNGEVWSPMLEGMEIYLVNASKSVSLGGEDDTPEYFSYSGNKKKFVRRDLDGNLVPYLDMDGDYYNTYPMYMYPQHWTYGSTGGYDREPYLKLVVPWARKAEGGFSSTQKQFYYKIVMPDDKRNGFKRRFARNNWYHLNIDVGILGAETDEASVTIYSGSCYVVYWQDKDVVIKQAEIGNARYLSVDKERYELYNVPSVNIRYTTSHPVIIKEGSIRVTRPYYGESGAGAKTLGGIVRKAGKNDIYKQGSLYLDYPDTCRTKLSADGQDWFENTGISIFFNHPLNNDYSSSMFDYSPYDISFTLVHEDRPNDDRFRKDITLLQRPGIYINALANSDATVVYIKNGTAGRKLYKSDYWGYVYVDNEQLVRQGEEDLSAYSALADSLGYTLEEYHWRAVWYTGGSRDIFNINVTVLPASSDLVIGDPRTDDVDNLRDDFHEAPALYGPSPRRLRWYHPTESSPRTANMLAPSYRIASKHGGVEFGNLNFEQAQWRCATYQEDGFPAGRWRLPTKGEIKFISMLSANKIFTYLFSNAVYWSANGAIAVSEGNVTDSNSGNALTRCVYDSWYWGDDQHEPRTEFVWGDME